MKHFNKKLISNKKLINFKIALTLSPLIMLSNCGDLGKKIIDQYKIIDRYNTQPRKEILEEKDRTDMVKKFREASDKNNPTLTTRALKRLKVYSESAKKTFFDYTAEEYDNKTLLGYAILKNNFGLVQELVKEPSIDINKVSNDGNFYSLQLALANKNHGPSIAIVLLESPKSKDLNFTPVVPTIPKENETKKQETKNNILHQAIINDYFDLARKLVSKDNKPKITSILNQPNHSNHTPLQLAVDKYLDSYKASRPDKDKNENSKKISNTHASCDQSPVSLIECLLKLEEINLTDVSATTWLNFIKTASEYKNQELTDLLLKHNNAPTTQIAKQAIKNKDGKLLQLLANNDTINLFSISYPLSKKVNDTPTLLYELVKDNQPDQVKLLIRYFGTSHGLFRKKDIKSQPILEKAVERYIKDIKYLSVHSQGGVEVYYVKKEYVKTRHIIKLLLDDLNLPHANFARLNSENAASWIEVIEKEVADGREDLIKLLANHKNFTGSPLDKALQAYAYDDNSGDGFLHRAVRNKLLKQVQILTNFTNWINLQNAGDGGKNNDTALHIALYNGGQGLSPDDIVIIKELLKAKGIDVNIKNSFSNTPLHFAAAQGSYEIAEKLINEHHADKTILNNEPDSKQRTPYDIAKSTYPGNTKLVNLLKLEN